MVITARSQFGLKLISPLFQMIYFLMIADIAEQKGQIVALDKVLECKSGVWKDEDEF